MSVGTLDGLIMKASLMYDADTSHQRDNAGPVSVSKFHATQMNIPMLRNNASGKSDIAPRHLPCITDECTIVTLILQKHIPLNFLMPPSTTHHQSRQSKPL